MHIYNELLCIIQVHIRLKYQAPNYNPLFISFLILDWHPLPQAELLFMIYIRKAEVIHIFCCCCSFKEEAVSAVHCHHVCDESFTAFSGSVCEDKDLPALSYFKWCRWREKEKWKKK